MTLGGMRFRLRPVEAGDLEYLRRLRNHPETRKYLGDPRRITAADQTRWFRGLEVDRSRAYYLFEKREASGWVRLGMARTHDIDRANRSMGVGGDIAPAHRGQGYGTILYRLIFRLGFGRMRLHRLWLHVLDTNPRARNLYKKVGFREVGLLRQAIRRGTRFHDYVVMDILRPEAVRKRRRARIGPRS